MNSNTLATMRMSKIDIFYIAIFYIGIIGFYCGIVNMYFWLILLLVRLSFSHKKEVAIFCLLFGSNLFGRMFESTELVIVITIIFPIVGFIILRSDIRKIIINNQRSYLYLSIIVIFFCIYFLLSSQNSYAQGKIVRLVVRAYIWLTTFLILFQSKRIFNKNFTYFFLLLALFYLSQAYQLYGIKPDSLFDLSFFREEVNILGRNDEDKSIVNPHTLGYLSCGAMAFYISKKGTLERNYTELMLLSLLSFFIIVISGARQTLVCYILIYSLAFFVRNGKMSMKNFFIACCILFILCCSILALSRESDSINKMLSSETLDKKLNRDITTPFIIMEINPTFGIGFGEYPNYTIKNYPHNIILEIICEEGFFGLVIILLIVCLYSYSVHKLGVSFIYYIANNQMFLIIFLTLFFMRSMISGDISEGISIFSILFCYRSHSYALINSKYYEKKLYGK